MKRQIVLIDIGDGMALDGVLPTAVQGGVYSAFVLARGGSAPYAYTLTAGESALTAAGITLDRNTGEVESANVLDFGYFPITIRATDITGAWVERSFVLAVVAMVVTNPPTIMGHLVLRPTGSDGVQVYAYQISGGTPPYTASIIAGALPDGMRMDSDGVVKGGNWYTGPNDFSWTIDVVDAAGQHATLNDYLIHSHTIVYVSDSTSNKIYGYDPSYALALDQRSVGGLPAGLAANASGSTIYCANNGDDTVSFVHLGGPSDVANVGSYPVGVCVSNDGTYVYCANSGDGTVSKINASDPTDVVSFAISSSPSMIRINPATGQLYIVDYNDSSVYIRDGDGSGAVYDYLYVPYATSVCVNAAGTHVFVGAGDGTLAIFDASTWLQVGTVVLSDASPFALALSRDETTLFVADNGNDSLKVVDVTNKAAPVLITTVDVGGYQSDIAADPNVDDMYVSLGLGGVLIVHASGLFDVSPLASTGDGGIVVVPA